MEALSDIKKAERSAFPLKSPQLIRVGGKLTRVDFADGSYKMLTRDVNGRLSHVDQVQDGVTVRQVFNRDASGKLLGVNEIIL
jgi:hypothetical protein